MSITDQIQEVRLEFKSHLESLLSENGAIDQIRIKYLGRKGLIADLFIQMGKVDQEERPHIGKVLNELKTEISLEIDGITSSGETAAELDVTAVDYTLPGDPIPIGSIHPLTQVMEEIKSIFLRLGFSLAYGPEIDTEF